MLPNSRANGFWGWPHFRPGGTIARTHGLVLSLLRAAHRLVERPEGWGKTPLAPDHLIVLADELQAGSTESPSLPGESGVGGPQRFDHLQTGVLLNNLSRALIVRPINLQKHLSDAV